jgi:hypothetical protein
MRAAGDFSISGFDTNGLLSWTNAFTNGVCTVEGSGFVTGPWRPVQNVFSTNSVGVISLTLDSSNRFFRALTVDLYPQSTPGDSDAKFTNLVYAYGILETVAGSGQNAGVEGVNYWLSSYEGDYATNANLSRPHIAMADDAGNIFIVDRDSHSILKVTTDGRIHTVAGTHQAGNGPDVPTAATNVALNLPNGEWVRGEGSVYILDRGNSKIRRLDTNGLMTTLLTDPQTISKGRGFWVNSDESLFYWSSGTNLRKWTPAGGYTTLSSGFVNLGNLVVDLNGSLVVTDQGANRVYRVASNGSRTVVAGDGSTKAVVDGSLATSAGLWSVRGVWFLPTDGYLLALQYANQISYVDPAGLIYTLVNGATNYHSGDGQFFYSPGYKISTAKSVTMDRPGNILIVENEVGYVRRIRFLRLQP